MYKILCKNFFQKYTSKESVLLEIGAGYCEFINNIQAKEKIALDLNKDIKKYVNKNIQVIISDSTNLIQIKKDKVEGVFVNNFFEHIEKENIIKTIVEIKRVLKKMVNYRNHYFC